jgi:HK97 family phage portal protein
VESRTASGLLVEHRAAFPTGGIVPNPNDPADVPPATVGPPAAVPGDPNGLVLESGPPAPPWPRSRITPSPWSGWPAEWATPNWQGRVEALTDTAWGCLDLNASILASMPPYLVGASPSLPADWLNNPDPDQYTSWEEFAKQLSWDYQLGEVYVLATARYSSGYPARFHVVDPWLVNAEKTAGGRCYTIGSADVTGDILHIRYQSRTSDAHGHGPLEVGAGRLVAANALARYASNMAAAGGVPNAVLKHPGNLNATQAADLQAAWVTARMSSMGLPAVLSGGIDFELLQISPKDMALVELSQWNESRIAVLLGVPPFLMGLPSGGDSMTYSNTQSLFDYHWRAGLRTKARPLMAALSGWALPRGTTVEVNRDEYVKPGPLERAQTWQTLNNIRDADGNPVLTVAQIQELERYSNAVPSETLTSGVLQ